MNDKKNYFWVKKGEHTTRIGLTKEAQEALGDVKYVELPDINSEIKKGESSGEIEAQKAVVELESPVDGKIVKVNDKLNDNPELLNGTQNDAWFFEVNN
ncbi:glycine cleavage system protein H [Companilactobacillus crustorum]|uniref:Glycine cleavage system protein H n=3 Tax=Companilactobacillus TaxID=2767879 RepID=A0A837RH75_9LACO|nr:glycine cleavage system protein H [Companilactobacillus crustorum]HCD08193.1 glycine cleavage system protein H [Lactobacillus sp.]APU71635.1 Glycine cleavage system H protein [Companilactobacillus crustorum]KRK42747.1 glycine cleavage system protein H [Companilactobacillus crustorum JCM 15951]KRO20455.1 glycine cleavage system protein H [Companilactobacillus crustorum]WDT66344.1 glycine cleavage system protein H [Companilactobacillus crustorum]